MHKNSITFAPLFLAAFMSSLALARPQFDPSDAPPQDRPLAFDDNGGMREPPEPRGPGGPMGPERKILKEFDADGNGRLEGPELDAAREQLRANPIPVRQGRGGARGGPGGGPGGPGGGPGGPGGPGGGPQRPAPSAGRAVSPTEVTNYPSASLYDASVVRTIFFTIDQVDWEAELELFHGTDIDVPSTMIVDGVEYPGVGLHFRGASSYMTVPKGSKRSLNVSVDHSNPKQQLLGHNTLNLLNCNGDPSMLSTLLYSHLAAPHIAVPKANFVEVVINGASWGVFVSVEQFNAQFVKEYWPQFKGEGARWKVPGSPQGSAGLDDKGDDLAAYQSRYEIKSKDRAEDWDALVHFCEVLTNTPTAELEAALTPILDIDGALWFLALDMVTANSDGFWTRASDYSIYLDPTGVFHILPHDMNESFKMRVGGPGMRGRRGGAMDGRQAPPMDVGAPPEGERRPRDDQARGKQPEFSLPRPPQGGGVPQDGAPPMGGFGPGGGPPGGGDGTKLDPLTGLDDGSKALRSKLLAVPSLRARYLAFVKTLAQELAWSNVGAFIKQERDLIAPFVERDTRKLSTYEDFLALTSDEEQAGDVTAMPSRANQSLRAFCTLRSKYLLEYNAKALTDGPMSNRIQGRAQ